ncbi:Uncharacterised protein [uncultured archaeon]|nr:Uncharacterised protein [uncultured archaeon]
MADYRIFLFLLVILLTPAHGQETISEGQISLNGYVDPSGKVLITGYASPESLSYMPFLDGIKYTFDNNTNQLYAVTDMLTSKSGDTWSLNLSLDGYYSDYSVTFFLPPGSEITKFETQHELNYQVQVKEDSLTLSIQGYRVVSPWIKLDYKLPAGVPGQADGLSMLPILLTIVLIVGVTFAYYRHRNLKPAVTPETNEIVGNVSKTTPGTNEIQITGEMQKVIDTLSEKEKTIIGIIIKNGGSSTQADIRYETGIPKSSLTGIINALKRKNIIKKVEKGRTNIIELSEWFLSEKELK